LFNVCWFCSLEYCTLLTPWYLQVFIWHHCFTYLGIIRITNRFFHFGLYCNPYLQMASICRWIQIVLGSFTRTILFFTQWWFLSPSLNRRYSGLRDFLGFWFGFGNYWMFFNKHLISSNLSSSLFRRLSQANTLFLSCL